jgi:CRISPR-associated protein Csd1
MTEARQDDAERLRGIMKKIEKAESISIDNINMERKFYLLCLSPAAGRISVRFFYTDNFGKIITNIIDHYLRMDIISDNRTPFDIIPLWLLLNETTVSKKSDDVSPLLGGQVLKSILTGADYPATLYNAMLTRIRAGEEVTKTKAAVFKAVLYKKYKEDSIEREVTAVSLNVESKVKPYVLGRLFSVLEKLQKDSAGGSLNATIRDKYFATACANPASVFPTLLRLSMHHSAKLDNSVYYEKLKTGLLGALDVENPFPAALTLDEQGIFILGYYHQTQFFYTPKNDKENKEEAVSND